MNIVIVGGFGPPILACIRSWGRKGYKVGFVCIGDENGLKPKSRYLSNIFYISSDELYQDKGISKINSFLNFFKADVLSCIDDNIACWLSDNASCFDKNTQLAFASSQMIKKVLSKRVQNRIAINAGLDVLPEYYIDNDNIETITIEPGHFPLCLRPSDPNSVKPSFKVKLIHSQFKLKLFVQALQIKEKLIGQPFKDLPNLVVHGIRTKKKETKWISAFIVERKFEGVTLTLKPYQYLTDKLIDKCIVFLESFDLTGNFHFEFLLDPETKQTFFLEINLRFGGTTAKALACGYDEPMYAFEAFGVERSSLTPLIKQKTVSNKQAVLKYMAKAVQNQLTPLDFPCESIIKKVLSSIKILFFCSDEILSSDDIKGSVSLYMNNVIQNLKGLFAR